jgi:hypothetical protein
MCPNLPAYRVSGAPFFSQVGTYSGLKRTGEMARPESIEGQGGRSLPAGKRDETLRREKT